MPPGMYLRCGCSVYTQQARTEIDIESVLTMQRCRPPLSLVFTEEFKGNSRPGHASASAWDGCPAGVISAEPGPTAPWSPCMREASGRMRWAGGHAVTVGLRHANWAQKHTNKLLPASVPRSAAAPSSPTKPLCQLSSVSKCEWFTLIFSN